MWNFVKKILINGISAKLVRKEMGRDELLRVMKEKKDVLLTTFSDGRITGTCNSCRTDVGIIIEDEIVWYICPKCNRVSFNPTSNLHRDIAMAEEYGGSIEQEIYYFRDLPERLKVPKIH